MKGERVKERQGERARERERDGGISLMPRAVRWPWLNASPNSLGPLIRPMHSGRCACYVCACSGAKTGDKVCLHMCMHKECVRLCMCVCVSQHQFSCVNMLTWHNTSRHFEVGNSHCNLPPSLSLSLSLTHTHTVSQRRGLTLATFCGLACGH